jgi:hypothetical protein
LEANREDPVAASIVSTGAIIGLVAGTFVAGISAFCVARWACRARRREPLTEALVLELDGDGAYVV